MLKMEYTNIDQKINSIENTMKSLMNKNTVVYSNHSKTSDTLSNGICSLTINSINKSFIFTYAKNNITISPLNNSITNLQFINEISVDDLITAKNIMNNQYLIDTFSNINNILEIYQKYVKIENETVMINKLLINGVDIEKELSDLNRYVDRYIEDADVKFEVINESILNLNNNTITVNEEISDINDKYTEFREEFKNHTHDGQYVKPVDIEELRTKMTGIEYNKVKIGTVEEERTTSQEVYEIYTSIDHDLKVNGYINGIDITKLLKLENDALIIKDILSFNSLINLVIDSDDKLIIRFSNDNSIVFESSGIISSVTSKSNKFYYDNFLTKQMLIDDEDIIDILFNKITDENGNTTSSPKKSAVEQIFDIIDFGLTILDTAATVGPMIAQIKKFGWTGYLYKTFGIVSSKSGGYIPLELLTNTVMTRSVIIDDSTNTDNVESYESPNYEDVDEDFNEFQYVANLFPSIDKIFASLKRYYSNVEKGQRTNYLGLLLVDAQIHDKLMNHTHDEFALIDHVHSYNDLTDVPETFTPTEHTHSFSSLTDIPETFTPAEHNHDDKYSPLNHTHTDLTLNTLNNMPIIGNNSEYITTYPFIPTVGWYPFNIMQNLDFHNQTKSGYIWRLCAYTDKDFQILNNGTVRLTIDKYGVYINKNLRCDTINGINTSNISLNTHKHSYNDLNDIPETFTPSEHTHSFTSLTDIPETFTPSEHTHSFTSLTDIPDTFPPAEHNHDTLYSKLDHSHILFNQSTLCLISDFQNTTFVIGNSNINDKGAHIAFSKSTIDPYLYLKVIGGSQLSIYKDRATFDGDLNVTSLNGITPSNISLNGHTHTQYSLTSHTHTLFDNDLTISTNDITTKLNIGQSGCLTFNNWDDDPVLSIDVDGGTSLDISKDKVEYLGNLTVKTLNGITPSDISLNTHTHTEFNNDLTINGKLNDFSINPYESYRQNKFICDYNGATDIGHQLLFHYYSESNHYYKRSIYLRCDDEYALNIDTNYYGTFNESIKNLFSFGYLKDGSTEEGVAAMKNATYIKLKHRDSTANYDWMLAVQNNHDLIFYSYSGARVGYLSSSGSGGKINTTITHNAPIVESLNNYEIGSPVFMSGHVYRYGEGTYVEETTSTDCISSVKSTGTYKEFLGIVVNKHKSGDKVTIGDVVKYDVEINQETVDFATHGDYYFRVDDSSKYKIGDTVLYDGSIVDDDVPITNKIIKSTIGSITGIINEHYVSVFKS